MSYPPPSSTSAGSPLVSGSSSSASSGTSVSTVSTLPVNGIEMAYQTFGEPTGIPVLLIMGLGTQMLAWPDGFCRQLADRGHHVVRFDNRDAGLSTHLDAAGRGRPVRTFLGLAEPTYRLVDMARDAAGLLEALGWTDAHVVGVSMGGMIAQNLALLRPALLRSLTSISSTTGALLVGKPRPRVLARMLTVKPATDREGAISNSLAMYAKIRSPGFPPEFDQIRAIAGIAYDRRYDPAGSARQFAAIMAAPDRTTALRRVSVPTLVIHGTADPLIHVSGGKATAAAIPGSRLVTIPGMGHDIPAPLWPQLVDEISATVRTGEQRRSRTVDESAR